MLEVESLRFNIQRKFERLSMHTVHKTQEFPKSNKTYEVPFSTFMYTVTGDTKRNSLVN